LHVIAFFVFLSSPTSLFAAFLCACSFFCAFSCATCFAWPRTIFSRQKMQNLQGGQHRS